MIIGYVIILEVPDISTYIGGSVILIRVFSFLIILKEIAHERLAHFELIAGFGYSKIFNSKKEM